MPAVQEESTPPKEKKTANKTSTVGLSLGRGLGLAQGQASSQVYVGHALNPQRGQFPTTSPLLPLLSSH